jgi:hypothetical protein
MAIKERREMFSFPSSLTRLGMLHEITGGFFVFVKDSFQDKNSEKLEEDGSF